MNTSAFWIIALGFWVFVLQSKIKHLEKIVAGLLDTEKHLAPKPMVNKKKVTIIKPKLVEVEEAKDEAECVSAVSTLKTEYASPKVSTRVIRPKEEYVPAKPSWLISMLTNYFTGGNLLVRIGGVILFFGLAFLLKYAAEHSTISIEMRLWGIGLAAVALIATGWKLRAREGAYGQILQGLGVAMLYLVIYGASKFYGLLSLEMAFVLMLGVVVLGSVLAVIEDSLPLVLFATAGGFLVPILTSSGEGSHVVLFSYYAFLNLGLFVLAWFRSWRVLNIVGFLFTFVIATAWGMLRYQSDMFATTEPFLILYFFMYLGISILFTIKHPYEPKNLVDGTLVFGLPVVAFPLQLKLVSFFEYGAAYSAVVLGVLYLGLFYLLKNKERTGLLAQSFLALGVVFLTIAVPYVFNADVSAALWSLESAGIVWIALKQNKVLTRYFGQALLFLSLFVYPSSVASLGVTVAEYLGYLVLITAVVVTSYLLDTHRPKLLSFDRMYARALLGISVVLWFMSTPTQMMRFSFTHAETMLFSLVVLVGLASVVIHFSKWKMLVTSLQGYFPLGVVFFAYSMLGTSHPFEGYGIITLSAFIVLNYALLHKYDKTWTFSKQWHILTLWLMVLIGILEIKYHVKVLHTHISFMAIATVLSPVLFSLLFLIPKHYLGWLETHRERYQLVGVGGLVLLMSLWTLKTFGLDAPSSTAYMPLFNPLDLTQTLVLGVIAYWVVKHKKTFGKSNTIQFYGALSFMTSIFITVVFARAVHVFGGVDYSFSSLWQDDYFQTGLSILWSIIAIVLMLLSKRYGNRPLWLAGFGLLILVVLKLFFVELANSGTIERIISFMVVGTLLLIIGYFVPLPPSKIPEENNLKGI